jgi:hypothetical protein
VSFTAPASIGGSAITSYTVTSSPGGITASGSASPITVTGLTNWTAYTFSVTATNSSGTGFASSASSAVTPASVPSDPAATQAVSGGATTIASYISGRSVGSTADRVSLVNDMRSALNITSYATTTAKANAKKQYIDSMIAALGASVTTIPSDNFTAFKDTLISAASNLTPKSVTVYFPPFVANTATLDMTTDTSTGYIHVEVPVGYTLNLKNGLSTYTLVFDGTSYTSGVTSVPIGTTIILGNKSFQLVGIGSVFFNQGDSNNVVCLSEGTNVLTPDGEIAIEKLSKGDNIKTGDGRSVPIVNVEKIIVVNAATNNAPYVIEKGAFGINTPPRPLRVSPRHAIQIKPDLWELPREAAKENKSVCLDEKALGDQVIYYHIQLPNYATDTLITNGIVTECLNTGEYIESYEWDSIARGYKRILKESTRN